MIITIYVYLLVWIVCTEATARWLNWGSKGGFLKHEPELLYTISTIISFVPIANLVINP